MKLGLKYIFSAILLVMMGCVSYKQLKPKAELVTTERNYVKLSGEKLVHLKPDKKYYVEFPAIQKSDYLLVLKIREEKAIKSYLTSMPQFKRGEKDIVKITDASKSDDNMLVFKLDNASDKFYWVIDEVTQKMDVDVAYRYMEAWRFHVMTKRAEFGKVFSSNRADRQIMETLGAGLSAAEVEHAQALTEVQQKMKNLRILQKAVFALEKRFPEDINHEDKLYLDYKNLKDQLNAELKFCDDYAYLLGSLKLEKESRANTAAFVAAIPQFVSLFQREESYPENVRNEFKGLLKKRLDNLADAYAAQLKQKRNLSYIDFPAEETEILLEVCEVKSDARFSEMLSFVSEFNDVAPDVAASSNEIASIKALVKRKRWPSSNFYPNLQRRISRIQGTLPELYNLSKGKYAAYPSIRLLNSKKQSVQDNVAQLQNEFLEAAEIVAEINHFKSDADYKEIRRILKEHIGLEFLVNQYSDIDKISLSQQAKTIAATLEKQDWAAVEAKVKQLHEDEDFLNYAAIQEEKDALVKDYEYQLMSAIKQSSEQQVAEFIEAHKSSVEQIDKLYKDGVFQPVHDLTFSAEGNLYERRKVVQEHLDSLKGHLFPVAAIQNLYKQYTQEQAALKEEPAAEEGHGAVDEAHGEHGEHEETHGKGFSEKASAILAHGKYYKGSDAGIKGILDNLLAQHQAAGTHESGAYVEEAHGEHAEGGLGVALPLWSIIPFVGILLSIAILPLVAEHFWHHNFGKVALFWGALFAIPFLFAYGSEGMHEILHVYFLEYFPFIVLLWSLYTIAGGILVQGAPIGIPRNNLVLLLIGTVLASWIGTTGAAMVLIRPFIAMNKYRKNKIHLVVFFIFLVANIGGALTPLGDPPLFLGFLQGVEFFWTLNLFTPMSFVAIIVMGVFYLWDNYMFKKEGWHEKINQIKAPSEEGLKGDYNTPLTVRGLFNLLFLGGVIAGVLFSGQVHLGEVTVLGVHMEWQNIIRDFFLILMGLLSLKLTPQSYREGNDFNWFPIMEVAKLFAAIFITIIPALAMLKAGKEGQLSFIIDMVEQPWHYFWITGILSSFLDNAPTYLVFFNTALGKFSQTVTWLMDDGSAFLRAISSGAVFFGAMTYIGNAPNFMVKSIAEQADIKMPSFFGYMAYSVIILGLVFITVTFVFF